MKLVKLLTIVIALFTTFSANAEDLALDGYCPVCYIAAGKAAKGTEEFQSSYEGKTYYFVSSDVKDMFDKEPTKWLPQYDGFCAYGMALGKKFESDPTAFTVAKGKLYLNKNKEISTKFQDDQRKLTRAADKNWKKMQKEMKQ